jgi:hypothetical protein
MPRLVVLQDEGINPLSEEAYLDESALQRLLEEHPELIALDDVDPRASPLIPIGREIPLAGQQLDLLFLDLSGRLAPIETKLRRNSQVRREVVGQVLEYGAYLSTWSVEDVERQAARYLVDPQTPARFRGQSLYELLSRVGESEPVAEGDGEAEMRSKIADALARRDMRLIIAVDRVVEPLRTLVTFVNSASRFGMYLLEVQQFRAPDGMRIASISVYGGAAPPPPPPPHWDEARFFQTLQDQAGPASAAVIQELYGFMGEQADSVLWGTGTTYGSVGFGVRRGGVKFAVFWMNTKGQIYLSASVLGKRVPQEALTSLLAALRSLRIDAPDDLRELTFDAGRLAEAAHLQRFTSAVLEIKEAVGRGL